MSIIFNESTCINGTSGTKSFQTKIDRTHASVFVLWIKIGKITCQMQEDLWPCTRLSQQ